MNTLFMSPKKRGAQLIRNQLVTSCHGLKAYAKGRSALKLGDAMSRIDKLIAESSQLVSATNQLKLMAAEGAQKKITGTGKA